MANIIEAIYPYSYTDDSGTEISFREGDRFLLLEKSSADWWKVQRTGVFTGKNVCFVPASYMEEVDFSNNEKRPTNHYVNLEVFQKIVQKDFDGLAKLGQKPLVISKDSSEDLPSPPLTPDSSFESSPEVRISPVGKAPVVAPKSHTLPAGWRKYRDNTGRSFYYNEESQESKWKPPRASISDDKIDCETNSYGNKTSPYPSISDDNIDDEFYDEECYQQRRKSVDDVLHRRMERENNYAAKQQARKSQAFFPPPSENDITSTPLTASKRQSYDPSTAAPVKEGNLHRQKLQEGGKYIKKPSWQHLYCCVIGSSLVFYKDAKTANPKNGFPSGKPESSLDLRGASLDPVPKEKSAGKKHVFQVSSYQKQSIQQFSAENEIESSDWVKVIHLLIHQLEKDDPLPLEESPPFDGPRNLRTNTDIGKSSTLPKRLLHTTPQRPPSRSLSASDKEIEKDEKEKEKEKHKEKHKDKEKSFFRKLSRVNDEDKEKRKIKEKLKKYLSHRPTYNELEEKGIVKDYVFGFPIQKVCEREDTLVPKCIVNIINEVESRGVDLDGIYRVSGNLSMVQKLRVLLDHGGYVDFDKPMWNDTHLLTGTLKLYFRELPEPLIPFSLFDKFINAMRISSRAEQIRIVKNLLTMMPRENMETLHLLITHLQRVTEYSSQNRMDASNLSIVFGPTLMFPENPMNSIGVTTVYQNRVVELLILEYDNLFEPHYSNRQTQSNVYCPKNSDML